MSRPVHVVVPLKGGTLAKMRLASVLGPHARAQLSIAMAGHVLAVVLAWDAAQAVTVVTGCSQTAVAASALGATVLTDTAGGGTAAACLQALERLAAGTRVLFINGDLPLLSAAALHRMAALPQRVVIAHDIAAVGTNALLMDVGCGVLPAFGADSVRAHLAACRTAGLRPALFDDRATAFDIDTPNDLAALGNWGGRVWDACAVAA